MTHLGDLVCALTDGGLADDAREEALAHLAVCGPCNRQAADQRRVKTLLAKTGSAPAPTPDLLERLLAIPEVARVEHDLRRSRSRRLLGRTAPSRAPVTLVGARRPASRTIAATRSSRRVRGRSVAAAGFAASVVVGLGSAVSGSAAVTAGAQTGATLSVSSGTSVGIQLDAAVPRPGARVAVAVVYRRP